MRIAVMTILTMSLGLQTFSWADLCQSSPSYNEKGEYAKCIVTIDKSSQTLDSKEVDSLACTQYCSKLSREVVGNKNLKSNGEEGGGAQNRDLCPEGYQACLEGCGSDEDCWGQDQNGNPILDHECVNRNMRCEQACRDSCLPKQIHMHDF